MLTISVFYISTLALAISARPANSNIVDDSPAPGGSSPATSFLPTQITAPTTGTSGSPQPPSEFQDNPIGNDQNSSYTDVPLFNPLYPQKEIRTVAAKYSNAPKYLRGENMSILPNFTKLASELRGGDPTVQVAGSTFVLGLQTYGTDLSYYGQMALGTPPQPFMFDVDTGSADLWLPSECARCNPSKAQFSRQDSTTYYETEQPFTMAYGTGDVQGIVALDTVSVGPFSVERQSFGAIHKESDDFTDVPFDGIIGMAFSSISATREATFMERMIQERQVNSAIFGVHLTRHQPRQSEVCIGCYDPSKYVDTVAWNSVTSKSYWNIALENIQVNGINTAPRAVTAAIDTGTSLIYLPHDLADALYRQMPGSRSVPQYGAGLYTYPCAMRPTVSLAFGDRTYEINLRDFNLGKTSSSGRDCVGGILAMGKNFPSNLAIIGAEFLKSWYSVYDYDNGARVGFARSINNT